MAKKGSSKLQWRINQLIGVVLILVIFCAVQFVNYKQFYRKNITSSDYLKLSELTTNLIQNLPEPVKITTFISPQGDELARLVQNDVQALLEQYRYTSKGKIELFRVDPFINFDQAQAVAREFKLNNNENAVVIQYGDRSKVIKVSDMAQLDNSGKSFNAPPKLAAFKGEQELTSGIQALVLGEKSKIYFLTGHGEYDIKAPSGTRAGYSLLGAYIERQNAEVIPLNLLENQGVPEDADVLVIGGPQQRLTETELNLLRTYLKKTSPSAPRLILMLDPDTVSGLEDFLDPYGVFFDNDLATALYNNLLTSDAVATVFADHPVMAWARATGTQIVLGRARSLTVKMVPGAPEPVKLAITPTIYWGETDMKNPNMAFDINKDLIGPLVLAAAIDSGTLPGGQVQVDGPQIIAVGSANFLINQSLGAPQLDFFLNAMNWMLGKRDTLGITPKQPQEFRVSMLDRDKQILTSIVFLIIPGVMVVVGLLVWLRRRK